MNRKGSEMNKKTIVITGANRGIGEQLARLYATPHHHLILIARQEEKLADVATFCKLQGATVTYAAMDVREAISLKAYLLAMDDITPIDLLIANAGIAKTLGQNWRQETEDDIEQNFSINVQGTLNTINPLLQRMIQRKRGQIALMSSMAALRGLPQSPSYCASKAALNIYGQSLRAWLSRFNVKVSVIFPGYIKTAMSDRLQGPKPFLISSERAAKIIYKGLQKNKARIAFPWQLHILMKIARALPSPIVDIVLNRFESYASEG
jgi:short-subunit dehydrogenase